VLKRETTWPPPSRFLTAESLSSREALGRPRALYRLGRLRGFQMRLDAGAQALTEAVSSAERHGDDLSAALARIELEVIHLQTRPRANVTARVAALTASAIDYAARNDDEWALAVPWKHACLPHNMRCRFQEMLSAAEASYAYGTACRDACVTRLAAGSVSFALEFGPTPALAAIRRCRELLTELTSEAAGVSVQIALAVLTAMRGERELAHRLLDQMHATAREHGIFGVSENPPWPVYGRIATNAGDRAAASVAYRLNLEVLTRLDHVSVASTQAAELARALAYLEEIDEAEELAKNTIRTGSADDIATQTVSVATLALVASRRGDHEDAVEKASTAVGFADGCDWLTMQSDAYLVLADVQARRGELTGAHTAAEAAFNRFQAKENLVGARRAQAFVAEFHASRLNIPRSPPDEPWPVLAHRRTVITAERPLLRARVRPHRQP
jgi:hypothetical protein